MKFKSSQFIFSNKIRRTALACAVLMCQIVAGNCHAGFGVIGTTEAVVWDGETQQFSSPFIDSGLNEFIASEGNFGLIGSNRFVVWDNVNKQFGGGGFLFDGTPTVIESNGNFGMIGPLFGATAFVVWDAETSQFSSPFLIDAAVPLVGSNGSFAAIGTDTFAVWDDETGQFTSHSLPGASQLTSVDGDFAAIGSSGVAVWDTDTNEFFFRALDSPFVLIASTAAEREPALPIPGDYNSDGRVDASDYTVWRDTLDSQIDLRADGGGNGVVDHADYELCKTHFGSVAASGFGAGQSSGTSEHVPEPHYLVLIGVGVAVWSCRRFRQLRNTNTARRLHRGFLDV